jgi:Zn-dependent protease
MGRVVKFRRPNRIKLGRKSLLSKIGDYFFFMFHCALVVAAGLALYVIDGDALFAKPLAVVFSIAYLTLSVSFHEFGHSLVAYRSGDYSAKSSGYLQLNFLKYSDAQSSFFAILVFMISGIFLPAGVVYLNEYHIDRKKMLWVYLAGPFSDVVTLSASVLLLSLVLTDGSSFFNDVACALIVIKVVYIVFNLLPLPSLDGYNALAELAPERIKYSMKSFGSQFGVYILVLVMVVPSDLLSPIWYAAYSISERMGVSVVSARSGFDHISLF